MSSRDRSTVLRLGGLSVAALALTIVLALTGALDRVNSLVFDRLMALRNRTGFGPPANPAVVHVNIDDPSVRERGGRGPGRHEIAELMRTLSASGAAMQVYDFVFAGNQDGDEALAVAARDAGRAYGGAVALPRDIGPLAVAEPADPRLAWDIAVEGDASRIAESKMVTVSFRELQEVLKGTGTLNVEPDADGVFRRVRLLTRMHGRWLPALSLTVACAYLGVPPGAVVVRPGHSLTLKGAHRPGAAPADIVIPIDAAGAMALNFDGGSASRDYYAFHDVWRDGKDPTMGPQWKSAIGGRIVLVADISTGRGDIGPVPGDPLYPLAGLHATAIRNILDARFIGSAPWWTTWAATGAAAGLLLWVAATRPRWLWPAGLLAAAAIGIGAIAAFLGAGRILNVMPPLLAVGLQTGVMAAWKYLHESRERELTRRAFESYFPPSVVSRLIEDRRHVAGSRHREVTVLFSDIVGFTSRAASMSPAQVQEFLNAYFSRMVQVVFRHGGTVDKFIGDGLMVFFNDPEDQPDHAARCVRCAIDLQSEVRELSRALTDAGEPALLVRIGITTGMAFVGDLGSSKRLSYTAVGGAVNLAQRLEAAAPGGGILMAQQTAEALPPELPVVAIGELRLKGFDAPVRVFAARDAVVPEVME